MRPFTEASVAVAAFFARRTQQDHLPRHVMKPSQTAARIFGVALPTSLFRASAVLSAHNLQRATYGDRGG